MGDYWEIMTMGWFSADGATIPNEFTAMTDGWWDTAVGGIVTVPVLSIVPIIHHQHMGMGGRAA